jgi:DNA-binding transcriptional LysR family regulator
MEYPIQPAPELHAALINRVQNKLRLRHLALLRALGDQSTLHQAAQELHMTQPAATKLLKDIEEIFNTRLFVRHPRGLQATQIGQVVIEFCRTLLGQVHHFSADIESKKSGAHGFLSIGAIMGAMSDVVSPALTLMKQRYPQLTIQLWGDTSDDVMRMLASHQIEFGVCRYIANEHHAQFSFQPLGNESHIFIASADHPLRKKRRLRLTDLADETWVMQPLPSPSRVLLEKNFAHHDMARPAQVIECNSIYGSLKLLKQMPAVALLSEQVAREDLASQQIGKLPLTAQGELSDYGIVVKRGVVLSPMAKAFVQALRQVSP